MGFLERKTVIFAVLVIFLLFAGFYIFVLSKNEPENIGVLPTPVLTPETAVSKAPAPEFAPDQIIVKFKEGFAIDEIKNESEKRELINSLQKTGVESWEKLYKNTEDPTLKNYYILKLKKGTDVLEIAEKLKSLKEIDNAEPNYVQKAL
ncbi:MAG: hypothetical protein M1450_03045 [Patescibacteria group bacterium]|nr:hypothetical protein [Patescibacteria group bacterium]